MYNINQIKMYCIAYLYNVKHKGKIIIKIDFTKTRYTCVFVDRTRENDSIDNLFREATLAMKKLEEEHLPKEIEQ